MSAPWSITNRPAVNTAPPKMRRSIAALLVAVTLMLDAPAAVAQSFGHYSVDISGTVTTGGTYQVVAVANNGRQNCTIQNPTTATEVLDVTIGTMASPYTLSAGASISSVNGGVTADDAISVTATTTGHAFAGTCQ